MNVTALQSRLRTRFRDPDQDVVTDAEWLDYLNDAYRDIAATHPDWPFLEQRNESFIATAGTRTTNLPADCFRVLAVYNTAADEPMLPIDGRDQVFRLYPQQDEEGSPIHYRVRNTVIEWYPLPESNTTIVLEYVVPPALLTLGADEPVFPEQYHQALVDGALARAYEDVGNLDMAALHRERFEDRVATMMIDLLSPRTGQYPGIVDSWWG